MEKINLTNYEAFFLDHIEGNLTTSQEKELQDFLLQYPELNIDLEDFELMVLEEEKVENTNLKNTLKREESTALPLVDYLMIAEVEGSITVEEKAQLSEMVQENPDLMNDLSIYHKVKLTDAIPVAFPDQSILLQKERKGIVWWQYSAAVAAAILFLLMWNGNTDQYYSPRSVTYSKVKENPSDLENGLTFIVEKIEDIDTEHKPLNSKLTDRETVVPVKKKSVDKEIPKRKLEKSIEEESPSIQFAENKVQPEVPTKEEKEIPLIQAKNDLIADATSQPEKPGEKDNFVPIKEFAKEKIKTDLLKGKTFSETVMDELEEVSNEKISFKREKNQGGVTQRFAINIGKFSLSRNK